VTDSAPGNETLLLLDFKDALEPLRVFNLDFPSNLTVSANEHHIPSTPQAGHRHE